MDRLAATDAQELTAKMDEMRSRVDGLRGHKKRRISNEMRDEMNSGARPKSKPGFEGTGTSAVRVAVGPNVRSHITNKTDAIRKPIKRKEPPPLGVDDLVHVQKKQKLYDDGGGDGGGL